MKYKINIYNNTEEFHMKRFNKNFLFSEDGYKLWSKFLFYIKVIKSENINFTKISCVNYEDCSYYYNFHKI